MPSKLSKSELLLPLCLSGAFKLSLKSHGPYFAVKLLLAEVFHPQLVVVLKQGGKLSGNPPIHCICVDMAVAEVSFQLLHEEWIILFGMDGQLSLVDLLYAGDVDIAEHLFDILWINEAF